MYQVDWAALCTPQVLSELGKITGSRPLADHGEEAALLEGIFEAVGGLPFAYGNWSEAHRFDIALKLLHEATLSTLRQHHSLQLAEPGLYLQHQQHQETASLHPVVDVNLASATDLAALPVIGPVLAERIVAERRSAGRFRSTADLASRISGIGIESAKALTDLLNFGEEEAVPRLEPDDFPGQFRLLYDLVQQASPGASVLEAILTSVKADPHPASMFGLKRDDLEPDAASPNTTSFANAATVKLLADHAYYKELPALLEGAKTSIDICMFYMALGGPDHPTRPLVDALAKKQENGCKVRVLLDRDDIGDPYGSRFINSHAARYLAEHGVTVHHDQGNRVLHSKFVLLDDARLVIGSHNWTDGSYLKYRDLSFVLDVRNAANTWSDRFDALWKVSTPYHYVTG